MNRVRHDRREQSSVLPMPDVLGPVVVTARYQAAGNAPGLGGDFYAACKSANGIRVLIGDVRGKGPVAAETAAALLRTFRRTASSSLTLTDAVVELERTMGVEALRQADLEAHEHFATAIVAEMGPDGRTLRLINRGHPAPLLVDRDSVRALEAEPRPPLGLGHLLATDDEPDVEHLPADSTLIMLTDGVTEARDRAGHFFDPVRCLAGCAGSDPDALLARLHGDVDRHVGGVRDDDLALLMVRRQSAPARRRPRRWFERLPRPCRLSTLPMAVV
jgi:serine phosphatase RsbU (regulator of sigma subunit)